MNIVCFGQQPCGFFPKRFFVAKIHTARALQKNIGGKIVLFYHDSDADYRETIAILPDRRTKAEVRLNFLQENKIQKKFSPLYAKKIPASWKEEMLKQLPRFADQELVTLFASTEASNAADFCLEMYKKMGLLTGIEIVRSGDKIFREQASELTQFYADVEYAGELVRAKFEKDHLSLHEGGGKYTSIPLPAKIEKWQKSAGRDQRFGWMQSVVRCTHYILGEGEKEYLDTKSFAEVQFIEREKIDKPEYAYIEN